MVDENVAALRGLLFVIRCFFYSVVCASFVVAIDNKMLLLIIIIIIIIIITPIANGIILLSVARPSAYFHAVRRRLIVISSLSRTYCRSAKHAFALLFAFM